MKLSGVEREASTVLVQAMLQLARQLLGDELWGELQTARPELLAGVTVADHAVDFDWEPNPSLPPEQVKGPGGRLEHFFTTNSSTSE